MKLSSTAQSRLIGSLVLALAGALFAWDLFGRFERLAHPGFALPVVVAASCLALVAYAIFALAICRWHRPFLVALAAAALVFLPARLFNERPPPKILIVSVEGLRRDRMSLFGANNETTPQLERWFHSGRGTVLFQDANSHGSTRQAALAALLTGRAIDTDAKWLGDFLPDRTSRVATTFGTTASEPALAADDFLELPDAPTAVQLEAFRRWFQAAPSNSVTLLEYAAMLPIGEPEPRFDVFVSEGADPPAAFRDFGEREAIDPITYLHATQHYDGSVLEMDAFLGRMLADMELRGELDNTLVVFTAPHGWAYREHGAYGTHGRPFDEIVGVPLVIRFPSPTRVPALRPMQRRIQAPTQHADVAATLCSVLGAEVPGLVGRDLSRAAFRDEPLAECGIPLASEAAAGPITGMRLGDWKLFLVPDARGQLTEELWRLSPTRFDLWVRPEDGAEALGRLRREFERAFGESPASNLARAATAAR
ncbi:MAG: sulfatase-like hydrolase/transferase [Planctomycetota bacterium]